MVTILTPIYGCCLLVRLSLFLKACQTESWHGSLQVSGITHSPSRGKKKVTPHKVFCNWVKRQISRFATFHTVPTFLWKPRKEERRQQYRKALEKMSRTGSPVHWLCPQSCFRGLPEEAGEIFIKSTRDLLSALLFFPFILDMALVIKQFL